MAVSEAVHFAIDEDSARGSPRSLAAAASLVSGVRDYVPFSAAMVGACAGKGYTLFSGQTLAEALAEGISDRTALVRQAAQRLTVSASDPISQAPVLRPAGVDLTGLVSPVRSSAAPLSPAAVNLTVVNRGVVGSRAEVLNWLTESLDTLSRQRRLPT